MKYFIADIRCCSDRHVETWSVKASSTKEAVEKIKIASGYAPAQVSEIEDTVKRHFIRL